MGKASFVISIQPPLTLFALTGLTVFVRGIGRSPPARFPIRIVPSESSNRAAVILSLMSVLTARYRNGQDLKAYSLGHPILRQIILKVLGKYQNPPAEALDFESPFSNLFP
jgi:hypothetical protein